MSFSIQIIDEKISSVYGMPCCVGEININSFKETFDMPLEWWTINDYKQQWHTGLARIKTHPFSCLVTEIQDPTKTPRVSFWPLYKEGDKIFIQNHLLFGKQFVKQLQKMPFTLETCYQFVGPREILADDNVTKISEWVVDLKDLVKTIFAYNNHHNNVPETNQD